jgi:hypothetical protein
VSLSYLGSDVAIAEVLRTVFELLGQSVAWMRWILRDDLKGFRPELAATYPCLHQALQVWGRRNGLSGDIASFHLALSFLDSPHLSLQVAVKHNRRDVLQRLLGRLGLRLSDQSELCIVASRHGHLSLLQWMHSGGCKIDSRSLRAAAEGAHWDIVRWIKQHTTCEWTDWVPCWAAFHGRLDMLQWARDNECPWDGYTAWYAAKSGHLEILIWALEHGCPYTCNVALEAARNGHVAVLRWLHEQRGESMTHQELLREAAANGHIGVLEYLAAHNPLTVEVATHAAFDGKLEALKWLRANGCPWDQEGCVAAAAGRSPEVIEWLKSL